MSTSSVVKESFAAFQAQGALDDEQKQAFMESAAANSLLVRVLQLQEDNDDLSQVFCRFLQEAGYVRHVFMAYFTYRSYTTLIHSSLG